MSSTWATTNVRLIAHYKFDGNADDSSGFNRHATAYNDFEYVQGVHAQAIRLVGSGHTGLNGGHVLLPFIPLNEYPSFTISMWVNHENSTTWGGDGFINIGDSGQGDTIRIWYGTNFPDTYLAFIVGSGNVSIPYSPSLINNWNHLVLRADNGILTGFINGQSVGSTNYELNDVRAIAGLGCSWFNSGGTESNRFIGSIDDVRIYDGALPSSEVSELYNAGSLNIGLVAHYKLDGTSGAVVDETGNNDGVNNGAARGVTGRVDNAFEFDGSDYISTDLIPSNHATASMWIRPEADVTGGFMGTGGTTNGGKDGWSWAYLGEGRRRVIIDFWKGNAYLMDDVGTPDGSVPLNQWSLITVVVDNVDISVYINGEISTTGTLPSSPDAHDRGLMIGRNFQSGGGATTMQGKIDEVKIWNLVLTDEQIKQLFESALLTYHVDIAGGDDSHDGLTRETAFAAIQIGIDTALDHDTVLVWPGIYEEACDFAGKAITVTSAADAAVVRNPAGYAFAFANGEGPGSVLSNLVLAGGKYGVYAGIGCTATLKNLTVVDNEFGIACYENAEPTITNCILTNDLGDLEVCTAQYSWVQQDLDPGADPMFADRENGDYHLLSERGRYRATTDEWLLDEATSPCVDAGDPTENPSAEPDPNGGRVNMGAYGNTVSASRSPWPLAHDSNRDGRVNIADFAAMAAEWQSSLPWAE